MQQAGDETIEVDFDEIMAEVADLIDSVRYGTDDDPTTARSGRFTNLNPSEWATVASWFEFANPYHDKLGRFAPKGSGRAVPTKGVEDSATIPDKTSLADTSYRGLHQPSPDGPPANNLLANNDDPDAEWSLPDDMYDHPEWYTGDPRSEWAKETIEVLRKYRGKPDDTPITVYRAAPGPINPGDWVTLSRAYAEQHAMSNLGPEHDAPIQEITVPVATIRFAGDDLSEFGYFPERFRDGS